MVVCDQNLHPGSLGRRHPGHAGDAVVDGDQQVGTALHCQLNNFRRQPIAILETIGDQKIDLTTTHGPQRQHTKRRARRTIGIEVADNEQSLLLAQSSLQQGQRGCHAFEPRWGQQGLSALIQLPRRTHAATGVDLPQTIGQFGRKMGIIDPGATQNFQAHLDYSSG